MWHVINKNTPLVDNNKTTLIQYFLAIFQRDFLLTSVPAFLLISCFLFIYKGISKERLKSNSKHLFLLFLFWTIVTNLLVGDLKDPLFLLSPHSLTALYTLLVGGTFGVYYFLISLIIMQSMTYLLQHIKASYIVLGFIASTLVIFSLTYYSEITGNNILVQYFSPVSFLPIPFLAIILYQVWKLNNLGKISFIAFFLSLGLITRTTEWYFLVHLFSIWGIQPGFPLFARPSLYFFSGSLVTLSFFIHNKTPLIIKVISHYSLAIYVTHEIFLSLSYQVTKTATFLQSYHINDLVTTFVCVVLAMSFSKLFSFFIKKEMLFP